jgi:hypothetical protein
MVCGLPAALAREGALARGGSWGELQISGERIENCDQLPSRKGGGRALPMPPYSTHTQWVLLPAVATISPALA